MNSNIGTLRFGLVVKGDLVVGGAYKWHSIFDQNQVGHLVGNMCMGGDGIVQCAILSFACIN